MSFEWNNEEREFLDAHTWAVLATGRQDCSPQQSMIGYALDNEGRLLVSVKAYTAKWNNARRQPRSASPSRMGANISSSTDWPRRSMATQSEPNSPPRSSPLSGGPALDPNSIVPMLDEQQRTVLRITPDKTVLHR